MQRVIEIKGNVFNPPNNEPSVIEVGDTVVWHNQDGVLHNAISLGAPAFHTPDFGPGNSVEVGPFTAATDPNVGIAYTCSRHHNMNGTIIVVLAGTDRSAFSRVKADPAHAGGHGG
jgi:plastocyanin